MNYQDENQQRSFLPKLLKSGQQKESPFSMPEDSEIFRMKEKEKDRKRQLKAENQRMKIWEKGVKKSGITVKQLNQLGKQQNDEEENQAKISLIEAAKSAIKNRVKINQPMHDFISKKRQTLLFQMLIDHKREKINEFEEMTRLHRRGLERAEKMLEEDMQAFNSYLNENKKQARDAIKKAELQTRSKNQKIAIIKQKLEIQADLTGKNMSKKQTLQNLRKYKLFLQSLNPTISEQQRQKIEQQIQMQEAPPGSFAPIPDDDNSDDEQDEIFFKNPQQLMDVFHSLQQSNLALISTLKQLQQQLQEWKSSLSAQKSLRQGQKNQLLQTRSQLQRQLSGIEEDIEQLRRTTNKDQISGVYGEIEGEVMKVGKEMEFAIMVGRKDITALVLLKEIQSVIERQLDQLKTAKAEKQSLVKQLEKQCFTEKRMRKREKNEQQIQLQKSLKQKSDLSTERQKRKGRPVMARSVVKKEKRKKQTQVREPQEEIERRKYLMPD